MYISTKNFLGDDCVIQSATENGDSKTHVNLHLTHTNFVGFRQIQ